MGASSAVGSLLVWKDYSENSATVWECHAERSEASRFCDNCCSLIKVNKINEKTSPFAAFRVTYNTHRATVRKP